MKKSSVKKLHLPEKKTNKLPKFMPLLLFTGAVLLFYFCYIGSGRIFGAHTDWFNQHSVFPDYFRKLFYETRTLFPQFALSLGGGQNIYHYAYYGFANPLILLSYFFPFISMESYMTAISLLCLTVDALLCYIWLASKYTDRKIRIVSSFLMILALPAFYHSAKQIMFIHYMPFLLLSLLGFDRYRKENRLGLYVSGILLMILSSFYFAVGGILVLAVYGFSEFLLNPPKKWTGWIKHLFHLYYPVLIGVLLSLFYLVPVVCAMKGGRSGFRTYSIKQLFTPFFHLGKLLYQPYGVGLCALSLVILFTCLFYGKCLERNLALFVILIFSFPFFCWLLNGGLYVRGKVLIPFLPLFCLLFASYLERIQKQRLSYQQQLAGYVLSFFVILYGVTHFPASLTRFLWIDFAAVGVILLFSRKRKILVPLILEMFLALCLLQAFQIQNTKKGFVTKQEFSETVNKNLKSAAQTVLDQDPDFYRMDQMTEKNKQAVNVNRILAYGQNLTSCYSSILNSSYTDFRQNIFYLSKSTQNKLVLEPSSNPLFLRFMGVKYLISHNKTGETVPFGYKKIISKPGAAVYKNDQVSPLAYVTNRTISEQTYQKLDFPYRQTALLERAVVKQPAQEVPIQENREPVSLTLPTVNNPQLSIETDGSGYKLHVKKNTTLTLPLNQTLKKDSLLFVRFLFTNKKRNHKVKIQLNGEWNQLSPLPYAYYNKNRYFSYTGSLKAGSSSVQITLGQGIYQIDQIKAFLSDCSYDRKELYGSSLSFTQVKGTDNQFTGTYKAGENSYFITTIPYDQGFQVFLDGKQIDYENVNMGFLGFRVPSGKHSVRIVYQAPGRTLGILGSLAGIVLLIFILFWNKLSSWFLLKYNRRNRLE